MEKIPLTFQYEEHYFGSFVFPLLEETRAELASSLEIMYRAPFAEVFSFSVAKGRGKMTLILPLVLGKTNLVNSVKSPTECYQVIC